MIQGAQAGQELGETERNLTSHWLPLHMATLATGTGAWGSTGSSLVICCRRSLVLPALARGLNTHGEGPSSLFPAGLSASYSFLRRPSFAGFRGVLRGLRKHCPAAYPVVIRTSRLPSGVEGFCKRRRNRFVIHLGASLTQATAIDTLLHEWSHALGWNLLLDKLGNDMQAGKITPAEFEEASHGPEFGTAFAAVWRAFSMKIIPEVCG